MLELIHRKKSEDVEKNCETSPLDAESLVETNK